MTKVGRNDPCPCGSGKKYKRCCLDKNRPPPPSSPDTMGSMKRQLQAALAAEDVESIEDAQRVAGNVMSSHNSTGIPEFHGLSPDEMRRFLYQPFDSPGYVHVPAMLDTEPVAPVVTLFNSLVEGIGDGVKATAKGNLPRRVVNAAAKALAETEPDEWIPRGNVGSEDYFPQLHDTRVLGQLAGLIDARGNKFALTKRCRELLAEGGMRSVYPVLLKTYANEFNWAYRDGYDDMPAIQHTFMFTLYLLTLYGHEYRESGFYEEAAITAFPMVVQETGGKRYGSAEEIAKDVYGLRTLQRFAGYFGLAEIARGTPRLEFRIRATPLLAEAVRFSQGVGRLQSLSASAGQPALQGEWQGKRVNIGYVQKEQMFAFKEFWMSVPDEEIVHLSDVVGDRESIDRALIEAVAEHRPASLCVNDRRWAEQLRMALPDVSVRVGPTPNLDDFAQGLQNHLAKTASSSGAVPYLMADIDAEAMARLFASAAALYKAEPWEYLEDWQYIKVDIPALDVTGACLSVIGAVSRDFGFLLFSSMAGYMQMVDSSEAVQRGAPLDLGEDFLSVNYQRGAELPRDNRKEIRRHNWEVAGPHAYPVLIHHGPDGYPLSLTLEDVRVLEACAMALAAFVAKWGERFKNEDHPRIEEAFPGPGGMEVWMSTPAASDSVESLEQDAMTAMADLKSLNEFRELDHQVCTRIQEFTDDRWPELVTQDLDRFSSMKEMAQAIFVTLFSATAEGNKTPAELFVQWELTDQGERDWIAAQARAWFSLWEVLETDNQYKVTLSDRLTGEQRTVVAPNLIRTLAVTPGTHLVARIVDTEEFPVIVSPVETTLSAEAGRELENRMFKYLRRKKQVRPDDLRKPKTARHLIKLWFREIASG